MSIKITFTKELTVDLNAYYPSLTRKLRAEIDAEILALVSGDKKPHSKSTINGKKSANGGMIWAAVGDDYRLTDPLREVRIDGEKVPGRGKSLLQYRALQKQFGGQAFLMDDAVKTLKKEFPDDVPSSVITNLWRFGHIMVERLEK